MRIVLPAKAQFSPDWMRSDALTDVVVGIIRCDKESRQRTSMLGLDVHVQAIAHDAQRLNDGVQKARVSGRCEPTEAGCVAGASPGGGMIVAFAEARARCRASRSFHALLAPKGASPWRDELAWLACCIASALLGFPIPRVLFTAARASAAAAVT